MSKQPVNAIAQTPRVQEALNIIAQCYNDTTKLLESTARLSQRDPRDLDRLMTHLMVFSNYKRTIAEATSYDFADWFSSGLFPVDEFVNRELLYQSCIKYIGDDQITRRKFMEWMEMGTRLSPLFYAFDYNLDRKRHYSPDKSVAHPLYYIRIRTTSICD